MDFEIKKLWKTRIPTSDFLDDFKTNLYSDEICVFTPKGDLFTLPKMQRIDFAFSVHTDVG